MNEQTRPHGDRYPSSEGADRFSFNKEISLYIPNSERSEIETYKDRNKPKGDKPPLTSSEIIQVVTVVVLSLTLIIQSYQACDSRHSYALEHRAILVTSSIPDARTKPGQLKISLINEGHAEAKIISVNGILRSNIYGVESKVPAYFKSPGNRGTVPPKEYYFLVANFPIQPAYDPSRQGWSVAMSIDVEYLDGYNTLRTYNICVAYDPRALNWKYDCADGAPLDFVTPTSPPKK